jgi:hypothetical protein
MPNGCSSLTHGPLWEVLLGHASYSLYANLEADTPIHLRDGEDGPESTRTFSTPPQPCHEVAILSKEAHPEAEEAQRQ